MRKRLFIKGLVVCLLMLITQIVWGESFKENQKGLKTDIPLIITSKKAELDNFKKEALYSGGVKVIRGDIIMTSDNLKVLFSETDKAVKRIRSYGNVKVWWKDRYTEADEGIYDDQTKTIIFSGSPQIRQGKNIVKGNSIIYYLQEDKVTVEGEVETIINIESQLLEKNLN